MKKNRYSIAFYKCSPRAAAVCGLLGLSLVIVSAGALASTSQEPSQPSSPAAQQKSNSQYPQLPEGAGKETLIRACSKCHSPNNVVANGQNREGWEQTLLKMAGLGAVGTDEDFTEIADYLVKNFPPSNVKVNMNKATATEIESQLGFSTKQADDIVAYREKVSNFKSPEDLKRVPQMDAKEVDARRNRMIFP